MWFWLLRIATSLLAFLGAALLALLLRSLHAEIDRWSQWVGEAFVLLCGSAALALIVCGVAILLWPALKRSEAP